MQSHNWSFETYNSGPSLIRIHTLRDLGEFHAKPCQNATSIDATHLQGNYLTSTTSRVLKEPVRVLLALHSADDAPCSVTMGHREHNSFGAVLRNPIIIVLVELAQGSPWPNKQTTAQYSLQVQGERHP
ncbi:MAG: hypothetical protein ABSH49_09980 [Bryobacteraceae bacterium]|jgi:hypothetical protein